MSERIDPAGVIRPEELYTLKALKDRLGIKETALRTARHAGLRVDYKHRCGFVLGSDFISYIRSTSSNQDTDR